MTMKKMTCFLLIYALMCGYASLPALVADASDAATYQEYKEQVAAKEASAFPNPDARYTVVTDGDYEYHVYDGFAVLSECKNTDIIDAVIPETVNDLPVVGLVESPFSYCHKLSSITLPDSFEHFSWYHLVENVTTKAGSAEEYLPSVSEIIVSETNPYFTVADGILYTKDMKTLVGCPPTLGITELNIPEQTDTIGDYAFFACMDLETAIIPENIEHINNNAFTACMNLKTAEIPKSITYLPGDMFFYCTSLSEVTFKGQLEKIGYGVFYECSALTDFVIPDTVTKIGWKAFNGAGCVEAVNSLQYVQNWLVSCDTDINEAVIRKGTTGIAEMSLFAIEGLKTIEVPSSVENIGSYWCSGFPSGELSVLHYRASCIPENTLSAARSCSDIYIYDPFCDIFDSEKTIAPIYRYYTEEQSSDSLLTAETEAEGDIVIHGYSGSTAQEYAEKYNRKFERIKPSGDVNGDGELNISDVVLLQKWILAVPDTHLADWKAADLCEDNRLDVFDLCLMKRELLSENNE